MGWRWRLEREDGTLVADDQPVTGEFPNQADAETWIGEHWATLLASGVDQVILVEDDREVYGPMSLHPPS